MKRTELLVDPNIADLVPRYLSARRNDVAAILDLVSREQYADVERRGHQMAGSGKAFGFATISLVGMRCEHAARRSDRAEVMAAVLWLEEYLDSLVLVFQPEDLPQGQHRG